MLNDPNQACPLCGTVGRVRVPVYRQTFVGYDAWDEPGEGTYFENEINYSPGNCACSGMGSPDPTGFGEGGEFYDYHWWAYEECCSICDCEAYLATYWTGYSWGQVFIALEQSWTQTCFAFIVTDMTLYVR